MKRYLGLFFNLLLISSSLFAGNDEETPIPSEPSPEEDVCEQAILDKNDKFKQLMDGYQDDEFYRIIALNRLLEKNHSLYLCEIDKIIGKCLELKDKRVNLNNFIRLVKAGTFFAGTAICGYISSFVWKNRDFSAHLNQEDLWFAVLGIFGVLSGLHGITELRKAYDNYDSNQLYYKAIAMKNALLEYRKNKINA